MSKWRRMMSGIPQGSLLGPALCIILVDSMDSGIECILVKFTNNIKPCGAVNTLEGRHAIQRDLGRLEKWAHANLMQFSKAKRKVLHMGQGNHKHKYRLGGEWVESSPEEKDLGVLADEKLNMTCSAWRREGSGETLQQPSSSCSRPTIELEWDFLQGRVGTGQGVTVLN